MKYTELNKDELKALYDDLSKEFIAFKNKGLNLNMARGKPDYSQIDTSLNILDVLNSQYSFLNKDYCNYGFLDGIDEAKQLFAEMLSVNKENMIIYGNSSLTIMFDTICRGYTHGFMGHIPWCQLDKVKFLCPVPGYDRHFAICERFGIEMINIPMNEDGPDMDMIEDYVSHDETIKGIWCVPQYSNPSGITYSDEVVKRLAALKPLAKDFRLFWDNAYIVHHLYEDKQDHVLEILKACRDAGNEDMVFEFCSTSKVTLAGSGVAALATSPANKKDILEHLTIQSISHDKLNQLRHVLYFSQGYTIEKHMKKHADLLRPKFEAVLDIFDKELGGLDIGTWTRPKGGYFISFDTMEGCAKEIVAKCKEAGIILTNAGATFPYGIDLKDTNIRIAPSYPSMDELKQAASLFTLCVKLVSINKLLSE